MPEKPRLPLLRASLLLFCAVAPRASGLTVKPLSLDELLSQSTRVLKGTVTAREYLAHDGTLSTLYTLTVEEDLAGLPPTGPQIVFRVPGGVSGDVALCVPGMPSFAAGERVVLFLRPGGGRHNIVGAFLGAFEVRAGNDGREILARKPSRGAFFINRGGPVRASPGDETARPETGTEAGAEAGTEAGAAPEAAPEGIPGPPGAPHQGPPAANPPGVLSAHEEAPDVMPLETLRSYVTRNRHRMKPQAGGDSQAGSVRNRAVEKSTLLSDVGEGRRVDNPAGRPGGALERPVRTVPLASLLLLLSGAALMAAGFALRLRSPQPARAPTLLVSIVLLASGVASGYVQITVGGHPVRWWASDIPVQWYANPDMTADCQFELDAVTSSFQTWEDVPTSEIDFDFAGAPPYEDDRYDSRNIFFWTQTDPKGYFDTGTLGLTLYWVNTSNGRMLDTDVIFNDRDYNWTTRAEGGGGYVVECVATHEIGHVLGLDHTDIPTTTMYPYYHDGCDTLHQDDIDGVTAIYPDTTPPAAPVITTNDGEDFYTTDPALTLEGTMSADTWTLLVNGSTDGLAPFSPGDTAWQFTTELPEPNTAYTFVVVAKDATGNTSAPATIEVTFRLGWPVIAHFTLFDLSCGSTTLTNWPYVGVDLRVAGSPITHYLLTESASWEPTAQDMLDFGYPDPYTATTLSNTQGLHSVFAWVMDNQQRITGAEAQITLDSVHPILEGARAASKRAVTLKFSEPVLGALNPAIYTVSPDDWQVIQAKQLSDNRVSLAFEDGIPEGAYTLSIAEGAITDRTGDNPLFIPPGATAFSLDDEWTTASALQVDLTHTLIIYTHEVTDSAAVAQNYRIAYPGFSEPTGLTPSVVETLSASVYRLTHYDLYQYLRGLDFQPSDFPLTVPVSIRSVTDLGGFSIPYNHPPADPTECMVIDLLVEQAPSGDQSPPQVSGFALSAFTSGSSDNTESRLVRVDAAAADAETALIRWYLTETPGTPAQSTIMNLGRGRPPLDFLLNVGTGVHTVYLHCMDAAGNTASSQDDITLLANSPPLANVSVSPLQEDVPPAAVILSDASASTDPEGGPIHSVTDFGDDPPWVEGSPAEGLYDWMGSYDVNVYVKDMWGAIDSASETVQIDLDTTPPVISVNSFTLHGQVDTPAVTSINIDGIDYPLASGSFDVVLDFSVTQHTWQVTADDGVNPPVGIQLRGEKQ